jgi:hypothetical protein
VHFALDFSVRAAIRRLLPVWVALALWLPSTALAADAPTPTASPAKADGAPVTDADGKGVSFSPTGGAWRERLIEARRRVLSATARLDEVNAEYARVLHERPDDKPLVAKHAAMRTDAQKHVREARAAIPPLVAAARADGVSEQVLSLYERGTLGEE